MDNKKEKKEMPLIKKMMIALIGGLVIGIGCLLLHQNLTASGNDAAWAVINNLLFQDITVEAGVKSIGLFYIIGQLFMNGLQLAIVPLVLVSISLALCSFNSAGKLGRIAGKTVGGFFIFYVLGCAFAGIIAYAVKCLGWFNVTLPTEAATEAATVDPYNPLTTIINAVPNNIGSVASVNTRILAVAMVAVIIGICMHSMGSKADNLKSLFETINEIIQKYLTFLINKIGPVAIFCMVTRTFAIYGIEYLRPALAYVVTAIVTLFAFLLIVYPLAVFVTTGLSPIKFIKKMFKVGMFGFSTNSSAATLPINTKTCQEELGCSSDITSFVLPMGMTINMNGTAIMHIIAVTFIATSAGIDITPANLILAGALAICASAGTPAIPVAGTTMIFTVLSGLGFTSDACLLGYALIVAINRPVEMSLLTLNVIGDATVNVIVNEKEGELDKEVYNS